MVSVKEKMGNEPEFVANDAEIEKRKSSPDMLPSFRETAGSNSLFVYNLISNSTVRIYLVEDYFNVTVQKFSNKAPQIHNI